MVCSRGCDLTALYRGVAVNAVEQKAVSLPLPIDNFAIPQRWRGKNVLLVPAAPEWAALDFSAVVECRTSLKHFFGSADTWPPDELTLEEDRADLAWHKREFDAKSSFAYHLLDHDASECLGCLYLYPTAAQEHDAEAYLWVHTRLAQVQATFIENEVIEWVRQCWPFSAVAWPGRFIPFTDWEVAARPNYYASNRVSDTPLNIGI